MQIKIKRGRKKKKCKGLRIFKTLKEEKQGERICLPDIQAHYKAAVINMVRSWGRARQINQWKKMESRNKPTKHEHLIFDNGDTADQWGKTQCFSLSEWCWNNWV